MVTPLKKPEQLFELAIPTSSAGAAGKTITKLIVTESDARELLASLKKELEGTPSLKTVERVLNDNRALPHIPASPKPWPPAPGWPQLPTFPYTPITC